MSLRVPKIILIIFVTLLQLVNVAINYEFPSFPRSVSLYAIPVLAAALFFSHREALVFTLASAIVYVISGVHGSSVFTLPDATDVLFLFGIAVLMSQLMSEHRNVRLLAASDQLTGLFNHSRIVEMIETEINRVRRYDRPMSLLMIDIDHFKRYNDTYGHQQGDLVLRETAYLFRTATRSTDFLGRYGGEEFVVILPETNLTQASVVGERIRSALPAYTASQKGIMESVYISIGVAAWASGVNEADTLIRQADLALYEAKRQGGNKVVSYTGGIGEKSQPLVSQTVEATSGA